MKCARVDGLPLWATGVQSQWGPFKELYRLCLTHAMGQGRGIYPKLLALISCELPITDSPAFLGGFVCRLSNLQRRLRKPPGQRI